MQNFPMMCSSRKAQTATLKKSNVNDESSSQLILWKCDLLSLNADERGSNLAAPFSHIHLAWIVG